MQSCPADAHITPEDLGLIQTKPGKTSDGKPFDWFVRQKVENGEWRLEAVSADVLGLSRPLEIYRAVRCTNHLKPWSVSDNAETYCPAHWADLAIGRGACGLRCRACFLVMTHRVWCDPARHVVYEDVEDYAEAALHWLRKPNRRNLGLGIDCSDSLLYEGVTGHARRLIPLIASPETNPHGCKLILLTKSMNVRYLEGLPTDNVLLTFSLNPEQVADLWEGKFDDGVRVTPSIESRLAASLRAQNMGFEVRWRVDPIMPVENWQEVYVRFFHTAAAEGHGPTRITLGTYRETQPSLHKFAENWGLPRMEWEPNRLEKDGMHYHMDAVQRIEIYRALAAAVAAAWQGRAKVPVVALCKEPKTIRQAVGLDHDLCNCGP